MELLRDWGDYQSCFGTLDRAAPGYVSNLYASREQIERWCTAGTLHALATDGAGLLLRSNRGFSHVYHVAESPKALQAALEKLKAGIYATDLVGKERSLDDICAIHAASGFRHHTFLQRMARVQSPEQASDGDALVATMEDAEEVSALLERLLDPYAEQLPTVDELKIEARDGSLLVVRQAGAIVGMLMYELKGQLAHLRFWHVDERARDQGVGRKLMGSFLARCSSARRVVLWVIGENQRSIAIYRKYGFEADGLLDRIMILRKEQRQ